METAGPFWRALGGSTVPRTTHWPVSEGITTEDAIAVTSSSISDNDCQIDENNTDKDASNRSLSLNNSDCSSDNSSTISFSIVDLEENNTTLSVNVTEAIFSDETVWYLRMSLIPLICIIGIVGFVLNFVCLYGFTKMAQSAINQYIKIIITTQNLRIVGYLGITVSYLVLPFKEYIRHGHYFLIQFYAVVALLNVSFVTSFMKMCMSLERVFVLILGYKNQHEHSKILTRPIQMLIVSICLSAVNIGVAVVRSFDSMIIPKLVITSLNFIFRFSPFLITVVSNICIYISL